MAMKTSTHVTSTVCFSDDALETHLRSLSTWIKTNLSSFHNKTQKTENKKHRLDTVFLLTEIHHPVSCSSSQESNLQITQDQMDAGGCGECIKGLGEVCFHYIDQERLKT